MAVPALVTPAQLSTATLGKISASDPRLPGLLDGATTAVRRYCGWHIAPSLDELVVLDGPGGDVLSLPTLHLTDLTSVQQDGVALDVALLEWSALGNVRKPGGCWTARYRGLSVQMVHGHDVAPDVAQIIMQVVSLALSSPLGATREQASALSVSWATTAPGVSGGLSLLARDLAILDSYRIVSP